MDAAGGKGEGRRPGPISTELLSIPDDAEAATSPFLITTPHGGADDARARAPPGAEGRVAAPAEAPGKMPTHKPKIYAVDKSPRASRHVAIARAAAATRLPVGSCAATTAEGC